MLELLLLELLLRLLRLRAGLLLLLLLLLLLTPRLLPEYLGIPEQRLRIIDVLLEDLGARQAAVRIDANQPEVFIRDGIFVRAAQETQSIGRYQLIDRSRVDSELSLILLNRPRVFSAPENQFQFAFAPGLHLVNRNHCSGNDRRSGCKKDQRSE